MPEHTCNLSGYASLRAFHNDATSEPKWTEYYVSIETNGLVIWHLDECQLVHEGLCAIMTSPTDTTRETETGDRIISFEGVQEEDGEESAVVIELAMSAKELPMWLNILQHAYDTCSALDLLGKLPDHQDRRMNVNSELSHLWEIDSNISISVFINDQQYPLNISVEDDFKVQAEDFVSRHSLNANKAVQIERAVSNECIKFYKDRESRLMKHISKLQRKVNGIVFAEANASHAESCASALSESMNNIKQRVIPSLQSKIGDFKKQIASNNETQNTLQSQIDEKSREFRNMKKELSQDYNHLMQENQKLLVHLDTMKEERDRMYKELLDERQKSQRQSKSPAKSRDVSPDASFRGDYGENKDSSYEQEVAELRKAKRALAKRLRDTQDELNLTKYELADACGKKSEQRKNLNFSDDLHSSLDMEGESRDALRLKCYQLGDQVSSLRLALKMLEAEKSAADKSLLTMKEKLEHETESKKEIYEQAVHYRDQLSSIRKKDTNNSENLSSENRFLKDQAIRFRGDAVRLQLRIDELINNARTVLLGVQTQVVSAGNTVYFDSNEAMQEILDSTIPASPSSRSGTGGSNGISMPPQPPQMANDGFMSPMKAASGASTLRGKRVTNNNNSTPSSPTISNMDIRSPRNPNSNMSTSMGSKNISNSKSGAMSSQISPLIEERIVRLLFHRYISTDSTALYSLPVMTLSRFLRFCKEFNLCFVGNRNKGPSCPPPYLVAGEIEIVFVNAAKTSAGSHEIFQKKQKTFGVRAGAGTDDQYKKDFRTAQSTGLVLTLEQFKAALTSIACKLYANLIEAQTGALLDCLPPQQKKQATRAALDVMMKKKILGVCDKLTLIPWGMIHVNEAIQLYVEYPSVREALNVHLEDILSWYEAYKVDDLTVFESTYDKDTRVRNSGITYKHLSAFANDFGLTPFIVSEPVLYKLFQEILLWVDMKHEDLFQGIPQGIVDIIDEYDHANNALRINSTKKGKTPISLKLGSDADIAVSMELPVAPNASDCLSLIDFVMLLSAIAVMAFPDTPDTDKLNAMMDLALNSGGQVLVHTKNNK